ncbi:YaeQ family protein [Gammaproteobacteria bacterium]|nr:YaeQ family protein [Gammaproteobacteria bacterium]
MALKPTIYKLRISLSNLDRNYYDTLNLTLAQHPSETLERMMVRVLAFCLHAHDSPNFTKGLSSVEEPDIWVHDLNNKIALWIDVGEPAVDRIKKAARLASAVEVYSFNSKSASWWKQEEAGFAKLSVSIFQFQWEAIKKLANLVQRTMEISITVTENSAYVSAESGECEIIWTSLQIRP